MLEKRVTNVNEIVQNFIRELQKQIRVEKVILFGSYCRKSPRDYSDIDIAVVSPDFEGGTEKDYLLLDRTARKIHPLIEATPYTPNDFYHHESGDFIEELSTTGQVVYPPSYRSGMLYSSQEDGALNLELSIKKRIQLGNELNQLGEKLNPYPRYRPFVKSFDSFKEYEEWRKRQKNPWLI